MWMKQNKIHHPNFQPNDWATKHYLRGRLRKQGLWATGNQDVLSVCACVSMMWMVWGVQQLGWSHLHMLFGQVS